MKAFVVTTYGPDGLREADVARPTLGPGDVRVEVRAASINPLDKMVRNGEFKQLIGHRLPLVLGHDLAGVVSEVGTGVTEFAVGDEVYARPRDLRIGAFAEEIAVDAADVALKPASLSFEEAAAVPLVALAAWQALVDLAGVTPGQRVLVHAGAGGLGSTVIQVAKHLGAHVATTAHTRDLDTVRSLGADEAIDYTSQDFTEILSGYDVVLDSLGAASLDRSLTVLKPGGLAISVVGPPDPEFARQLGKPLLRPVMAVLSRKVRRRAKTLGVRYSFFFMRADGARLASLATLYDDGTLRPVIDRTFGFDQTLEAMAYVEQGKAHGKIVVTR
ncbi:NADP-dependent oxidoreductase [Nocardioides terrigena]|uniref:NADP-dependent oxidoreductase n=1 Tax=Nocardioides terrigena TaxID=424797 RepID=UPI000D321529|nr:NADP-dependent oxidoreductase [Nocardioides terrigena]